MILQIVGYKKSGKTTLMRHIVSFLKSHGYTVATIKHHGHGKKDIQLQDSDVDHMKHFEAGADQSCKYYNNCRMFVIALMLGSMKILQHLSNGY